MIVNGGVHGVHGVHGVYGVYGVHGVYVNKLTLQRGADETLVRHDSNSKH